MKRNIYPIWRTIAAASVSVLIMLSSLPSCEKEPEFIFSGEPEKPEQKDTTGTEPTPQPSDTTQPETPAQPTESVVLAKWDADCNNFPDWASKCSISALEGKGTIRYVLSDQTSVSRSAFKADVNDKNPRITSPWIGDSWQFSSPVAQKAGDMASVEFRTRMSAGSMRYWLLEFLDGSEWKLAADPQEIKLSDGSILTYTADMHRAGSGDEFDQIIRGIASYSQPTDSVAFRFRCVSTLVANKETILTTPSTTASTRLSSPAGEDLQPCIRTYTALQGISTSGNICGYVKADGGSPIAGVVVSDGYEVTTTNSDGYYEIKSGKKHGYVFISVPSGYEAPVVGVVPQLFKHLNASKDICERCDFSLKKVNNDKCRIYFLGDIHLAGNKTTKDQEQFAAFGKDITAEMSSCSVPQYFITLGDMTWDCYWYSRTYFYPDYLKDITAALPYGSPVFHTIGNHDHDMNATGDWYTVLQYKRYMGPTYYSFNIGKAHFIVLDDIECTNPTASMSTSSYRSYNKDVVNEELEWLKKDLSYVSKDTPIFVTMHAPLYTWSGSDPNTVVDDIKNTTEVVNCFAGYTTHFVTGHTHVVRNIDRLTSSVKHFEHNAGAICGQWWRAYYFGGIHLATDGVPGGYEIFDMDGTDISWQFKGTGWDKSKQFNSYDLNKCVLDAATWIPNCTNSTYTSNWAKWTAYSASHAINFQQANTNMVLIHVWDYDTSWKIEVTEETASGSKSLTPTRIRSYDPLYIAVSPGMAYNNKLTSSYASVNDPSSTTNMFKVTASSATSTLNIKVTDRFGNVYTEQMVRPKEFSIAAYKK